MGGDCIGSDLVRYSTGYDFVKMVVQVACGEEPDFTQVCKPMPVESIFILNQHDVDVLHELKKIIQIRLFALWIIIRRILTNNR